jgi:hypothetical protein
MRFVGSLAAVVLLAALFFVLVRREGAVDSTIPDRIETSGTHASRETEPDARTSVTAVPKTPVAKVSASPFGERRPRRARRRTVHAVGIRRRQGRASRFVDARIEVIVDLSTPPVLRPATARCFFARGLRCGGALRDPRRAARFAARARGDAPELRRRAGRS